MSFSSLLTDRVDIYHLKERAWNYGYGIESKPGEGDKQYYYDSVPDYKDIPCYCYFANRAITKLDANNKVYETLKVNFLIGADVKTNSKIKYEGEFYILQTPKKIKKHHISVIAIREDYL